MVPSLLFDISHLDHDKVLYGPEVIESINPHRGAMRLIDGILHESPDQLELVAYRDVRDDEFWVPGHIPGEPIFPGVLIIEAVAQLSSFSCLRQLEGVRFMGFAGVEDVKFRGQVLPGHRLLLLSRQVELRRRRSISRTQALVNGTLVFEGTIIGMPMQINSPAAT